MTDAHGSTLRSLAAMPGGRGKRRFVGATPRNEGELKLLQEAGLREVVRYVTWDERIDGERPDGVYHVEDWVRAALTREGCVVKPY